MCLTTSCVLLRLKTVEWATRAQTRFPRGDATCGTGQKETFFAPANVASVHGHCSGFIAQSFFASLSDIKSLIRAL